MCCQNGYCFLVGCFSVCLQKHRHKERDYVASLRHSLRKFSSTSLSVINKEFWLFIFSFPQFIAVFDVDVLVVVVDVILGILLWPLLYSR